VDGKLQIGPAGGEGGAGAGGKAADGEQGKAIYEVGLAVLVAVQTKK
jgi:hypothetical protein